MHNLKIAPNRQELRLQFQDQLNQWSSIWDSNEVLKMDLHCHDHNSDVPDELWGRILGLPETWLKPKDLLRCLKTQGAGAYTITNHNNARSCWQLLDKGHDILSGAEFTCQFPEYAVWIHVLVYGFSPAQEEVLFKARQNIYKFLHLCRDWDLAVVQPHPLYFYAKDKQPPLEIFAKFAILFQNFEVLNGQRELWQNSVTLDFVNQLNEEKIMEWESQFGLRASDFCSRPYQKGITGGSDDHFGVFAGSTGVRLHIPDLAKKLDAGHKRSALSFQALKDGTFVPYGAPADEERLSAAFLDYFAQCTLKAKDPGLLRMMLHQGDLKDKIWCLGIYNGFAELRRHKVSTKFLEAWSQALQGEKPNWITKISTPKAYKPVLAQLEKLAKTRQNHPENTSQVLQEIFADMSTHLGKLIVQRSKKAITPLYENWQGKKSKHGAWETWIEHMEIPSHLRELFSKSGKGNKLGDLGLGQIMDQVQFPILIGGVLAAAVMGSTRTLFAARQIVNDVAMHFCQEKQGEKILWLTDTLNDANGVSTVLRESLTYVREHNLAIDFLVCDQDECHKNHLIQVAAVGDFNLPGFEHQVFKVPDLLKIHRIFLEGSYTQIICSTEMLMGPVALFLKHAFQVPAHFYMHTDWMSYLENNTELDLHGLNRIRRILRLFYQQFDNFFVLNREHKNWLESEQMGIDRNKIHQTAHWPAEAFRSRKKHRRVYFPEINQDTPILLFAGRLSKEKGIWDVVHAFQIIQSQIPEAVLVIAGAGPEMEKIQSKVPEAKMMGWLKSEDLAQLYTEADLLMFPSRFDTFGCSVLEAMSCGLPVIAYASKGPADIIEDGICGALVEDVKSMALAAIDILSQPALLKKLRKGALARSMNYSPGQIMKQMLADLGME